MRRRGGTTSYSLLSAAGTARWAPTRGVAPPRRWRRPRSRAGSGRSRSYVRHRARPRWRTHRPRRLTGWNPARPDPFAAPALRRRRRARRRGPGSAAGGAAPRRRRLACSWFGSHSASDSRCPATLSPSGWRSEWAYFTACIWGVARDTPLRRSLRSLRPCPATGPARRRPRARRTRPRRRARRECRRRGGPYPVASAARRSPR